MTTQTTSAQPPEIDAPPSHDEQIDAAVLAVGAAYEAQDWTQDQDGPPAPRYLALKGLRDAVRALDKALGAALAESESEVIEWMAENATDQWRSPATGQSVHIRHELRASVRAADRPAATAGLEAIGAGALVERTVNANTLSAWVREQVDFALGGAGAERIAEDPTLALPPEVRPYVQIASLTKLGTSKGRAKS